MEIDPTSAIQEMVEQCMFFSLSPNGSWFKYLCLFSGFQWYDGQHDAGSCVRHPRGGRGHELRRDHEVRALLALHYVRIERMHTDM